ncbi:hypothetical protein LXL04_038075 [Taraxacum kok-saghyz]
MSESNIGTHLFIPKMYLTYLDKMISFTLQTRQFTLVVLVATPLAATKALAATILIVAAKAFVAAKGVATNTLNRIRVM